MNDGGRAGTATAMDVKSVPNSVAPGVDRFSPLVHEAAFMFLLDIRAFE